MAVIPDERLFKLCENEYEVHSQGALCGMQKLHNELLYKILDVDGKWDIRHDTKKREESGGLTRVVGAGGVGRHYLLIDTAFFKEFVCP